MRSAQDSTLDGANLRPVMRRLWPLPVIMLLSLGWALACFNALQVGQAVDDASYVTLARSLASGQGYRMVCYAGAPPEVKYPPLLPLLIVPCLALAHGALWATRLPALLCMLGAIPVLWALLRRLVGGPALWLLVALMAVHPLLAAFTAAPMTETASLLLSWAVLLLLLQGEERGDGRRFLAAGVLLGLALLLRTDSVALLAAALLWLALGRRWRPLAQVAAPALLLFAPWVAYAWGVGHVDPTQQSYLHEVATGWWDPSPWPLRLWHGLSQYLFAYIPEQTTLVFGDIVQGAAAARGLGPVVIAAEVVVGLVVILGLVRSWRRLPLLIGLFVVVRLAMLTAFAPVSRYLLPILPFLVICLAVGLEGLLSRGWRKEPQGAAPAPRRVLLVLCALLLLPALARDGLLLVRPPRNDYPDPVAGGQLIAAHTPPGAVVLSNWSSKSFALYGEGRLVVEPRRGTEAGGPDELLAAAGPATHLLLVGPPFQAVAVHAYEQSPRLKLVAEQARQGLWLFALRR